MMARAQMASADRHALMGEALAAFELASAVQERVVANSPDDVRALSVLAQIRNNAGLIRLDAGDLDGALADYESARDLKRRIVDARPTVASYRADLARTEMNIGEVLFLSGRSEQAAQPYQEALDVQRRLVSDDPGVDLYRSDLANTLYSIGRLRNAEGRPSEAVELLGQGIELQEAVLDRNPDASGPRRGLSALLFEQARAFRLLGLPGKAASATRDRITLWESNPGQYYDAACDLSLCLRLLDADDPRRDSLAAEAFRMIRLGLDCDPDREDSLPLLARDPALRPLRAHDAFRELMLGALEPGAPVRFDQTFPDEPFARNR
jgi:tetratricopeptide (TPR) repeat protein